MSVQCPHCGGEFQVELTLSVPAVKHVEIPVSPKPVQPITASIVSKQHKFATHTDAGKFRHAISLAGYPHDAKVSTIFNDQRKHGRRLKMWTRIGGVMTRDERDVVVNTITAEFGDRMVRVCVLGGQILVYLNS